MGFHDFGISDAFNTDAVAAAAIGGFVLGCTVVFKTSLTGGVLGVSGYTGALMANPPPLQKFMFIIGLALAGLIFQPTYGGFEPMPPKPTTSRAVLLLRFLLGGAAVGVGTTLGNGCTSGHGLTGLARLTLRSWIAVPTFMASAVLFATLLGTADVLTPLADSQIATPALTTTVLAAVCIVMALALCLVLATFARRRLSVDDWHIKVFVELCTGLAFGFGLVISTMARPSKVAGFLDLGSGAWDPSLMSVMGSALVVTFPFFQIYHYLALDSKEPLLGGKCALPPRSKPVDTTLVAGAILFGIGWGTCGVCPGPMWVLLLGRPSVETLVLFLGMVSGIALMKAMRWRQAQKGQSLPKVSKLSQVDAETPSLLQAQPDLGVEVPVLPGDVATCGSIAKEHIAEVARLYRGWLYLNNEDDPNCFRKEIEEAGCMYNILPFKAVPTTAGARSEIVAAMAALPRPLMLQCSTATRASVFVLLGLLPEGGRSKDSSKQLATDLDLKAFTREARGKPFAEWALGELESNHRAPSDELVFEQLFDEKSSTFTYLLGCKTSKEAVLIDPVLEQTTRDLQMLDKHGLTLKYVVNTHCHADHITSGSEMKQLRPGVQTIISKASGAKADLFIGGGDIVQFGKQTLRVLATPGHTDGCVSYLLRDGDKQLVFTGDALLIRGCGRTDFQQGDSRLLYKSVHTQLFSLPGATMVYPGHDYKGRNVSSIEEERRFNPRLSKTEDEFVQIMKDLNLPNPKMLLIAVPANMQCGVQS
eukprot:TRINITY_DN372_c0_g1_i1.p1 TRINITY_DN372_c0_g1~~TRINITY_DN372_c0_g1_i1.p1  ORF type:complete len:761 (-),score=159.87 TRINITY_DN372_c0_g1_i1:513-2795(-)